jgi:hypothetical protein
MMNMKLKTKNKLFNNLNLFLKLVTHYYTTVYIINKIV